MNNFIKEIVFDHIIKVSKGLNHFLNFLKFPCGPRLQVQVTPVVPPLVFGQNF